MMELEGISTDGLWEKVEPTAPSDKLNIVGVKCGHWQHYRCYYQSEHGGGSMVVAAESHWQAAYHVEQSYGYEVRWVDAL